MPVTTSTARPPISGGWIARYGLMYFGQHVSWAAPTQVLLATQVLVFYPDHKEQMLGWLMAAGGFASIFAGPIAGRLSDRTDSRWGRRLPWMVGGTAASVLTLAMAGLANSYAFLLVAWVLFQIALGCSQTAVQAIPPDRVPDNQYGLISGVMGLTYTAGVVAASALAAALPVLIAYLAAGALMFLAMVPFAVNYREPATVRPVAQATGFNLPSVKDATDFWWVFLARLLVTLAQAIALFYLFYFLRDRVGYSDPATGVLILSSVYAVFVIISAVWSGRASDRTGKRRIFVSLSSFGVALASLVMAVATEFTVVLGAAAFLGLSWGVFQAIDQALINHVLPSEHDRAAHIGVVNLAVTIPNTAGPALAAILVTQAGGYPGLYVAAALLTSLGGVAVWKVRNVA